MYLLLLGKFGKKKSLFNNDVMQFWLVSSKITVSVSLDQLPLLD